MARRGSLPERLRYLQPFRKKFASRQPEELNEDTGEAPLFALLSKRVKGFSELEAQKLLEEDLAVLERWLATPENEGDCLQFVRGFLMISPSELVKRIYEEAAKGIATPPLVEMELPTEAKVQRVGNRNEAAMILKWKGLMVALQAMPEALAVELTKAQWQEQPKSLVTSSPVRFGNVHGTKYVRMTDLTSLIGTHEKEVGYLLEAPGGHVQISAIPLSKKINHETWDESVLENLFQTLRVVEKQNSTSVGTN
jgi:hypothetical protein